MEWTLNKLNIIIQFVRRKNEDEQVSPSVTAQVFFQYMYIYIYIYVYMYIGQSLVLSAAYIEGWYLYLIFREYQPLLIEITHIYKAILCINTLANANFNY
jgi:hypothetical protein